MKKSRQPSLVTGISLAALAAVLIVGAVTARRLPRADTPVDLREPGPFAEFVEPGFPFITSTVDATGVGAALPDDNYATRGIVLTLGDSTYATFDPDLLRMAVGWRGEFLSLTAMAQVSYRDSLNKNNRIPEVLGKPVFATGMYPGWQVGEPEFRDPRPPGPFADDPGRGPLPRGRARWEGIYVVGDRAVLAYTVAGTDIRELAGTVRAGGEVGITRTLRVGPHSEPLTMVLAEVRGGEASVLEGGGVGVLRTPGSDSVTAFAVSEPPDGVGLAVMEGRYGVLRLPPSANTEQFRVVLWRGVEAGLGAVREMLAQPVEMVEFDSGGPAHWPERVTTRGEIAPDTAAYVVDEVILPVANPWSRNVRPADIAFFSNGDAAIATYAGDLWLASGLEGDLERVEWRRFASGLYEPMSLEVVDDEIYVYTRSGLIRPRDLNGDGEADFYQNFSDLPIQTLESREFPLSMGKKPGGGFYLSRGGALDNGPRTSPAIMPGFRAGSAHSGTVMELSADGREIRPYATGLREPFIGVHPVSGLVTASDQQGNFVPSTPIYLIEKGGYYGVPATAHREDLPEEEAPITWIPHQVDQSGAGQAWVPAGAMGLEEDALIHVSYGRPGAFRIYIDSAGGAVQGAAISLADGFSGPLLKAEFSPHDEQLYVAGFQIWGTRSPGIRTLARVRYTGLPSALPREVSAGEQGLLIRFGVAIDSASAADLSRYAAARWNYQRTSEYGSGHFKLDGSAGEERLAIASAHLAPGGRTLLLVLPDMREVMQLQVAYDLRSASGDAVVDTLYLTVNRAAPLDLAAVGLGNVDWRASVAAAGSLAVSEDTAASAALGQEIFQRTGCVACHSVDGTTAGKLGPTMQGLFGSEVPLADGRTIVADAAYLRRAIEAPGEEIVEGYEPGMPAYLGVLSDSEIESLVLYIRSLE